MAEKTYKVVGTQRVHGTRPGEQFTAALGEDQERFLIDGGHIQVVTAVEPSADDTVAPDVADTDHQPADVQAPSEGYQANP